MDREQQTLELLRLAPRLKRFCDILYLQYFVGSRSGRAFTSGDIYQETCYVALKNADMFSYGGDWSYWRWLKAVARRESHHLMRPKYVSKMHTEPENILEAMQLNSHEVEALDFLENQESQESKRMVAVALVQAIEKLPVEHGLAVLYSMDGKDSQELSQELGVNRNTLRWHKMLACEKLKKNKSLRYHHNNSNDN